jgi:hypothetical protein
MAVPPYDITLVTDSQEENTAQNIVNTYEVTYTVPSLNGYTSQVTAPKDLADPVGAIKTAVEAAISQVQAIYNLGAAPPPAA